MDASRLAGSIERLVDHLRADRGAAVGLADIASVTEVLIAATQRFFASIDVEIYRELRNLSAHIGQARQEIAQMRPNDLKKEKIPRAGMELEAIVQATELATDSIMSAAEQIMALDGEDAQAYCAQVNDHCLRIIEACSFQDITGQRISKVVATLTHIEERLNSLDRAWGPDIADEGETQAAPQGDAALLNGPALAGEGIDQSAVDELLGAATLAAAAAPPSPPDTVAGSPAAVAEGPDEAALPAAAASPPDAKPAVAPTPPALTAEPSAQSPAAKPAGKPAKGATAAAKKAAAKTTSQPAAKPAPPPPTPSGGEKASQADIDALFN
ncbi:MAG: protein phosphatase CheZ [Alphaproteobacteria bacterium]|nr:protein phosphatase CheZ [Alphaproteobacteria bacterium]